MRQLLSLLVFLLFFLSAQANRIVYGKLIGKALETTYTAPNNLFFVEAPLPVDPLWAWSVEDSSGNVTFYDGLGSIFRIDYLEMVPSLAEARSKFGDRTFFEQFLATTYLPNTVWLAIPSSKLIAQEFSNESVGPVLMSWMFLPQGSAYTVKNKGSKTPVQEDTYRAIAVFVRQQLLFVVSVAPAKSQIKETFKDQPEKMRAVLEKNALDFARKISVPRRDK